MNRKLVLIDGHSIMNRTFYGIPELTNSEGIHTNAVYGFLNIMFKVFDEENADYCIVAFDVNKPTFRHEMYSEYKGTRKPMPGELREQIPIIKDVLNAMNIPVVEKPGYEADDVIGTLSRRGESEGMDVSVISGDRDLLQLATQKVQIRIPKTKKGGTEVEDYYADDVKAAYGVNPSEFIDVKALMGDTSDNVPGVPGVGEKTATKLISEYGSVENMYNHIDEMKNSKVKESLVNNHESAEMSRILVTINTQVPIDVNIGDAAIDKIFNRKSYEILKKLDLKSMLNRFSDVEKQIQKVEYVSEEISEESEFISLLKGIENSDGISIGMYVMQIDNYFSVSVAFDDNEVKCYVTEKERKFGVLEQINNIYKNDSICINTINLKNQLKIISALERGNINDVGIEAYLLNPTRDEYTYDTIAGEYMDVLLQSKTELFGKRTYDLVIKEEKNLFIDLMCNNAWVSHRVSKLLVSELEETCMYDVYKNIELPLVFSLNKMEMKGVSVEKQELADYGDKLQKKISIIEQKIYDSVGEKFNINSPKQLGEILFVKMGIKGGKKTKTGYSTAASVLEKLSSDYPVIADILEYRQLTKLNSTYAQGLQTYIHGDGRIYGTFNQTITATGRISSTEPNLQNIPIRMPIGKEIRKVFVPRKGCVFLDADYSQIELRILAHMSGDENLIEAYNEEKDIHRATAAKVFGVSPDEVTDEQRSNAKAVNFGIVYGISSFGLSQDLSISRKEAEKYINDYFANYPGIKKCIDGFVNFAKDKGYSVTMYGRRRPVPELKSSNYMQRSFGERIAMNSPIQGTAADIMKIAMINVDRRLTKEKLEASIVLQVHDELLLEVPENEREQVEKILREEMMSAANLRVPLEVSVGMGRNWLEAH